MWISLSTCCNFPGFLASQLSAEVLLENRETLLTQLFLWCAYRGHSWHGEEGESRFSSTFDFYINLLHVFLQQTVEGCHLVMVLLGFFPSPS